MKDKFLEIYAQYITREGADNLLDWLLASDFFTAPASTKYHLSCEGGLCEHSVNAYERLHKLVEWEGMSFSPETIAICGLLHDICKTNFYKIEMRNAKNEYGEWVKVPYYTVDDQLPYGHGEKSVYIISGFMRLSREEAMAIRWHMGGFDDAAKSAFSPLPTAFKHFPLALLLHIADMQSVYLDENSGFKG